MWIKLHLAVKRARDARTRNTWGVHLEHDALRKEVNSNTGMHNRQDEGARVGLDVIVGDAS